MYYLFVLTSLLSGTKNHKNLIIIWTLSLFENSPGDPRRRLKRNEREILNGFKPLLLPLVKFYHWMNSSFKNTIQLFFYNLYVL